MERVYVAVASGEDGAVSEASAWTGESCCSPARGRKWDGSPPSPAPITSLEAHLVPTSAQDWLVRTCCLSA